MGDEGRNTPGTDCKALIERVLRLKEEQDALSADIREVYAEAKTQGYDKTAMGQAVSVIRKKAKDPEKYSETNTLAQLYIDAYENGTGSALAHPHAPDPLHDPDTGEITEPASDLRCADPSAFGGSGKATDTSWPGQGREESPGAYGGAFRRKTPLSDERGDAQPKGGMTEGSASHSGRSTPDAADQGAGEVSTLRADPAPAFRDFPPVPAFLRRAREG